MTTQPKNPAAVALGRLGGKAGKGKAKARTSEQARKAALASVEARRLKRLANPPQHAPKA